jgi:hypothetical protein
MSIGKTAKRILTAVLRLRYNILIRWLWAGAQAMALAVRH